PWGSRRPLPGRPPAAFSACAPFDLAALGLCGAAGYSDRRAPPDELTARFRAAAALWRDVAGLTDERLAEQVRADGIDALIDLAGHTGSNRLLVFARKPAPVQVTWLGYEGTTGLEAMDD